MLSIEQERRLKKIITVLDDAGPAADWSCCKIQDFLCADTEYEVVLHDTEALLRLAVNSMMALRKSIERKLRADEVSRKKPRRTARLRVIDTANADEQKAV